MKGRYPERKKAILAALQRAGPTGLGAHEIGAIVGLDHHQVSKHICMMNNSPLWPAVRSTGTNGRRRGCYWLAQQPLPGVPGAV